MTDQISFLPMLDKIYNEDCRLFADKFSKMKICILTDPPYNVGYHYEGYEDNLQEPPHQERIASSRIGVR